MLRFQCKSADGHTASTRSGFDLGHMTFAGEKGICTSRGKKPDQAMMLAIAITELLYVLDGLSGMDLRRHRTTRGLGVNFGWDEALDES